MRKRQERDKLLLHSDRSEVVKESLPVELPESSLAGLVDVSLLIPYGEKNSVARAELLYSGMKNSVFLTGKVERPIVDSIFTKDIIRSTYNYKTESTVKLLDKVEKIINGFLCETTYIYETYKPGDNGEILKEIHIETIPNYQTFYKFGSRVKSELSKMGIGEESNGPIYTTYLENLDPEDDGMGWGKNINCIFSVSRDVGEDAIAISRSTADNFRFNYMDDIEFTISLEDEVLKNIYGDERTYKPFPLPGEYINKEGVVASIATNRGDNILALNDNVEISDSTYYVHGGIVYDIDVYCNYDSTISRDSYLYELYQIQREYIRNISLALSKLDENLFTRETLSRKNKLLAVMQSELRNDKKNLNNKVYVKLKICNECGLMIGSKITNRHGAKSMVSEIFPDGKYVASDGTNIDAILNISSTINRENSAQLYEKDLNGANVFLRKYLNESSDDIETKYSNLVKWIELTNQPRLVEYILTLPHEDVVEYYKNNWVRIKHDPFGGEMNLNQFVELIRFTNSIYPVEPFTIYCDGIPMSEKHYYGSVFFFLLKNFSYYDTSIRVDEVVNAKGSLAKRGESKKDHRTKMNTTSAKSSNLSTAIIINSLDSSDRHILENNTSSIHNYMDAIGIEFKVIDREEWINDRDKVE